MKKEYRWASVAGHAPEPVVVTTEDGKRVARTCGCPDPFFVDEPKCPCVLIPGDIEPPQEYRAPKRPRPAATHAWRG